MAEMLQLEVVTPSQKILHVETQSVTLPGSAGEMGILPNHIPLVTTLESGVLSYWEEKSQRKSIAVHWGYAQVEGNRITVLAEVAEVAEEIDLERAAKAEQKAAKELQKIVSETSLDDCK